MLLKLNIHKHAPSDVVTIAHRGGVLSHGAHENSRLAVFGAIEREYDMVEFDVASTGDHQPILLHGAWELFDIRERKTSYITFEDKTLDEARKLRHPVNDETILTLAGGLELCRGHLGVMLDFKTAGAAPEFYRRVVEAIDAYGFDDKVMTISNAHPPVRDALQEKALFAIAPADLDALKARWALSPRYFGFGIPDLQPGGKPAENESAVRFSEAEVKRFHNHGIAVVLAINTFQYYRSYPDAATTHMQRAAEDIRRYREIGVDGLQVDSAYDQFLFSR